MNEILDSGDASLYDVASSAPGPEGKLPLTAEMLRDRPSGDIFGMTQDAGMGWSPAALLGVHQRQFLILSTAGGMRSDDGTTIALGYHTGHFELAMAVRAAAESARLDCVPYAGYCSDPCDGRTQGTPGMFDSLAYRNDAASIFRRLVRSIPTVRGVLGVATCDKGLPAMMMALASFGQLPCVLVPGGVTLAPTRGEDTAKVQSIGARFARGEISLEDASEAGCRACASPGGGCQFLGTAATSQVVGEALGLALPHSALAPSGQPIWLDVARRSAKALVAMHARGIKTADVLTAGALKNALAVFAAFGGSTNLILHTPAIAYAAGLARPTIDDWTEVNRRVPRLVDVLPNGPKSYPTVAVYLAGGVPEVMLRLRELELLELDVLTTSGQTLGEVLRWWETSPRREALRRLLRQRDGVEPDEVIMTPDRARWLGVTSAVCFPRGNLAPEGSVIKSTAIDPRVIDPDGVYRKTGPARVFFRETDAIAAIKGIGKGGGGKGEGGRRKGEGGGSERENEIVATDEAGSSSFPLPPSPFPLSSLPLSSPIQPGDVLVLAGRGPLGSGMEEIYQITSALKYLSWGHDVAVVTDARFSGVSTGACIGLVGPEALAGGPLGKVRDGDQIRILIDRNKLEGSVDLVGDASGRQFTPEEGAEVLASRLPHPDLSPDPNLPPETRLWAVLQQSSGGPWAGCVFDVEKIERLLAAGRREIK